MGEYRLTGKDRTSLARPVANCDDEIELNALKLATALASCFARINAVNLLQDSNGKWIDFADRSSTRK